MKKIISLILVFALGLVASVANAAFILGTPTNLGPAVNPAGYPNISTEGLYIGAGNSLDAATFWSGLIDDVRIYDLAITH